GPRRVERYTPRPGAASHPSIGGGAHMGVIEKIAAWAGYERRAGDDLSWSALAPGIGYYAGVSARCAENLSTVLACTNAIATALAYVPALVYRRDSEGN